MKKKYIVITIIVLVLFGISIGTAFAFGLFYNPPEKESKNEIPLDEREGPSMMSIEEGLKIAEQLSLSETEKIEYSGVQKTEDDEYLSYDSEVATYKVQASSGLLSGLYRKDVKLSDDVQVLMDDAEQVAKDAIAKYRNDFNLNSMTKTIATLHKSKNTSYYEFEWRLFKQGVDVMTSIDVRVTATGEFMSYICNSNGAFDPDMSKLKISSDEIKALALSYLKSNLKGQKSENLTAKEPKLISQNEDLFWQLELETYEESADNPELPPDEYYYMLIINAETGEITNIMAG